ncbi:MAG: PAS domain S-box protein, partial [Cyanobacteria bacterium J06631_9]
MRSIDWSQTPLGPVERWSPILKTLVRVFVSSPVPTFILWGSQQAVLVNEACSDLLEASIASAIGHPANLALPKLWVAIHPLVSQVISTGDSVSTESRQWPKCCGSTLESQLVLIPIREDDSTETENSIENGIAGVMGTFTALLPSPQPARHLQIDHRQMALALAMGNIGTWQLNIETQELSASEQGRLNFGIAKGEPATLSKKAESIHPEDKARVLAAIENAIANRTNIDIEYRTLLRDGSTHWLVVRGQMVCDLAGEPTKMVGISTDITRRKQSENRVKESERRSRRIVDSNMFGVLYGDIVGGIHYANNYFSSLLGYTDNELTSGDISWDQLTPPEYATLDQQAIEELKAKGVCTPYEKVFQHREGHYISVLVTAAMLQRPYNETQQVIGVIQDLTALKQVEAERNRFFNLSPDIFAIAGDQGYFVYVSQAWETILGFTPAEVITTSYMDFIHPDDVENTTRIQQKLYEGFDVINFENRYRHKDGSYRWIDWNVTTLQDESKFYCVGHDITQRKQRETEREQLLHTTEIARSTAERANR